MSTQPATGVLMPHVLDDWPALIAASHDNLMPKVPAGPVTDAVRQQLIAYTRRLGPFVHDDTRRVDAAIGELLASNAHAVNGSRRVLLIDGPSAMGKSQAVVSYALRDAAAIWAQRGHRAGGAEIIPYIYLEVAAIGWARSLMQGILRFLGLPLGPRESTDEMLSRLRAMAPRLGVKALIIDDAHMLRTASTESRQLTDFLKGAITSLPLSVIFVGAGLRDSALLRQTTRGGYSAAEQIARRATVLDLHPWPHEHLGDRWCWLLASLETQLVLPGRASKGVLTKASTARLLHARSAGHPGVLIDWIKRAAVAALTADTGLTQAVLARTAPPKPRPLR